jgi:hypothetical protein
MHKGVHQMQCLQTGADKALAFARKQVRRKPRNHSLAAMLSISDTNCRCTAWLFTEA